MKPERHGDAQTGYKHVPLIKRMLVIAQVCYAQAGASGRGSQVSDLS
jgi:hypothetical protein